jgi:arylsulfatase A-like enzyme
LEQNTVVIFASDNGALPTFQGARSAGFRGSKLSLYEGGTRLPFIVRWPGHAPAARVEDQTIIGAVDLLPTLCAITGAALPAGVKLDGEDMSPSFLGKTWQRQGALFWEYGRNTNAFSFPKPQDRSPNLAVREGPWKLLLNADGTRTELYQLELDPAETRNRAAEQPALTKRLSEQLLAWRKAVP